MGLESIHKHHKEMLTIIDTMLEKYKEGLLTNNIQHVIRRFTCTYSNWMRSILRLQECADVDGVAILKEYDNRLKRDYRELYERTNEVKFLRDVRWLNYRFVKTLLKFAK